MRPSAEAPVPTGLATEDDLAQLYRLFLGREAEPEVLARAQPRPLALLMAEMCASQEINHHVLHALVQGRDLPHEQFDDAVLGALDAWLVDRLRCEAAADEAAAVPARLLARLYAHPAVAELLLQAHGSLFTQALDELARRDRAGALRLKGRIEFANREHISGWALDLSGRLSGLRLEIRLEGDGRLLAAASAHSYRPDIQRRFGGEGLAGFRARWDPRQFPPGVALSFTLHEAGTGATIGLPYRFENSFFDQLGVAQVLAHELESIQQRLDALVGMVPQALSYCAFPLEHYRYYRRSHRVPPPRWLLDWQDAARLQRRRASALGHRDPLPAEPPLPPGPHFLVLLDATARPACATAVRLSADSLREQVAWPHWSLGVVGEADEIREVAGLLGACDGRVHHLHDWHAALALLCAGSGAVTRGHTEAGCCVLLLQAGETLDEHALAWIVQAWRDGPTALAWYWDEDALRHRAGRVPEREPEHVDPILRTPFDPHSMLELNVVGTSFAVRADALRAALDRLAAPGAAAAAPAPSGLCTPRRERLVWALHRHGAGRGDALHHIPRCLLTRTEQAAAPGEPAGAERLLAREAPGDLDALLPAAWQGRAWQRVPDPIAPGEAKRIVRWQPRHEAAVISVLIPTRDHWQLMQQCTDSLRALALHPRALDLVVADNGSTDPDTLGWLRQQADAGLLRVLRIDEPFNWSRLNNRMALAARGEHLLFLNNDTRMLTREWDSILRGELEHPGTGAVGARLLYEDMTLQHAGVVFGYEHFVGHSHVGLAATGGSALPLEPRTTRRASAVTGAFLACRREVFLERVGPFNETELGVTFNDVEWCVRVTDAGLAVVYAPLISLVHYESKSRGFDFQSPAKQARADYERLRISASCPGRFIADAHASPRLSGWTSDRTSLS